MSRQYKAFISYRHRPLDLQTAKRIHRRIEHYIIPKALRKDGKKKLGYVFRDQDELPISSDLTASIRDALDRSEYLIVICTPETEKSLWVLEEIRYFLSRHDHNHVLAILAEGTSDESFPRALREIYSADGELIDTVEPLAANIVADSDWKRRRLFRTESLRILAALIGCAYDDLYRREQRYRLRRLALSMAAVIALAAGFIGMLLDRNAEIRENYVQALRNQSQYLASESLKALDDGDRLKAISLAVEALPAEGSDRPRVSKAEYALGCALGAYLSPDNAGSAHAVGMLPHANTVKSFVLNDDATLLCSFCQGGALVGWDLLSMQELWTDPTEAKGVAGFRNASELIAWTDNELYCIDAVSGERKWSTPVSALDTESWAMISRVCVARETGGIIAATGKCICFIDGESGAVQHSLPWPERSPEGEPLEVYAFDFQLAPDGNLLVTRCRNSAGARGLIVLDLRDGSVRMLRFYDGDYYLADSYAFLNDRFFYSTTDLSAGSAYSVYDAKVMIRSEDILHCVDLTSGETLWETAHAFTSTGVNEMLRCDDTVTGDPLLIFAYANHLDLVDPVSGELLVQSEYSSRLVGMDVYNHGVFCITESGELGQLVARDFSKWSSIKYYVDDLLYGKSQDSKAWVLQQSSQNIVCYDTQRPDPNWVKMKTLWASSEDDPYFNEEETIAAPGCLAFLYGQRLLINDGDPSHPLRELSLPNASEYRTEYDLAFYRDGLLGLYWSDRVDRGILYVDPVTAEYRVVPWTDESQVLIGLCGVNDGLGWLGVAFREEASDGEAAQILDVLVLNGELKPVKTIELGRFRQLTEWVGRFDPSGRLYVYLPDTKKTLRVELAKGGVTECGDEICRAFAAMHESGTKRSDDVIFSPDGSQMALLQGPAEYLVLSRDGRRLYTISGESQYLLAVSFTPDGRYLLTVESDGLLRRYRAADGELLSKSELVFYGTLRDYTALKFSYTKSGFLALQVDTFLNMISMEDWGVFAYVPGHCAYLEDHDVFVCRGYSGGTFGYSYIPRYTVDSLISYGQSVLNGWEMSQSQRMQYGLD